MAKSTIGKSLIIPNRYTDSARYSAWLIRKLKKGLPELVCATTQNLVRMRENISYSNLPKEITFILLIKIYLYCFQ